MITEGTRLTGLVSDGQLNFYNFQFRVAKISNSEWQTSKSLDRVYLIPRKSPHHQALTRTDTCRHPQRLCPTGPLKSIQIFPHARVWTLQAAGCRREGQTVVDSLPHTSLCARFHFPDTHAALPPCPSPKHLEAAVILLHQWQLLLLHCLQQGLSVAATIKSCIPSP